MLGVRVPSGVPDQDRSSGLSWFFIFLAIALNANQASCPALAFLGRDPQGKNVPQAHFSPYGFGRTKNRQVPSGTCRFLLIPFSLFHLPSKRWGDFWGKVREVVSCVALEVSEERHDESRVFLFVISRTAGSPPETRPGRAGEAQTFDEEKLTFLRKVDIIKKIFPKRVAVLQKAATFCM